MSLFLLEVELFELCCCCVLKCRSIAQYVGFGLQNDQEMLFKMLFFGGVKELNQYFCFIYVGKYQYFSLSTECEDFCHLCLHTSAVGCSPGGLALLRRPSQVHLGAVHLPVHHAARGAPPRQRPLQDGLDRAVWKIRCDVLGATWHVALICLCVSLIFDPSHHNDSLLLSPVSCSLQSGLLHRSHGPHLPVGSLGCRPLLQEISPSEYKVGRSHSRLQSRVLCAPQCAGIINVPQNPSTDCISTQTFSPIQNERHFKGKMESESFWGTIHKILCAKAQ